MTRSTEDDFFEEFFNLLSKAKYRYHSAHATVVHTIEAALAKEANRRFIDRRFDQDNSGMAIIGKPGPPERKDFYHEYDDSEKWIYLWHRRLNLWREERRTPEGNCASARSMGALEV